MIAETHFGSEALLPANAQQNQITAYEMQTQKVLRIFVLLPLSWCQSFQVETLAWPITKLHILQPAIAAGLL
jgi:hypothetical protein